MTRQENTDPEEEKMHVVHIEIPGKSPDFKRDSEEVIRGWVERLPIPSELKEKLISTLFERR